jgi:hypothetical protein
MICKVYNNSNARVIVPILLNRLNGSAYFSQVIEAVGWSADVGYHDIQCCGLGDEGESSA